DRLPAEERVVLDCASVQGKVFYESALAAVSEDDLSSIIESSLDSLLQRGLVRPERSSFGGRGYRFRPILLRDAAYESVPKEARAQMHEGIARWLESAAGDRATEYAEIVGYHFEQAWRYREQLGDVGEPIRALAREAAERLGNAGRRAFSR